MIKSVIFDHMSKEHTSLRIDSDVKQALKDEAKEQRRSFNNHAEGILQAHVSKAKQAHVSKQEYKKESE